MRVTVDCVVRQKDAMALPVSDCVPDVVSFGNKVCKSVEAKYHGIVVVCHIAGGSSVPKL